MESPDCSRLFSLLRQYSISPLIFFFLVITPSSSLANCASGNIKPRGDLYPRQVKTGDYFKYG